MIIEFEGQRHEFPDGTKPEDIASALAHHSTAKSSPLGEEAQRMQESGSFMRGIPILGAFEDRATAAVEAAANPLTDVGDKGDTFSERYDKNLKRYRAESEQFQREHPMTEAAGEILGGVVSTGALAQGATGARLLGLTGETLPGMVARSAASGGVINAADAAARGSDPATAAGVGVAVGVAGPVVGRFASLIARPFASTLRGIRDPSGEAARRVAGSVARDIEANTAGLSPRELVAAQAEGQPVNIMDMGDETTRALARSAANTSPEGRAVLDRSINQRFDTQADRLTNWLRTTFNYPDAVAQKEALDQVSKTVNKPAYVRAYRDGANGLWSPELERLAGSDAVSAAMKKAAGAAKDEAIVSGYGAMNPRITFTEDGRIQFTKGPAGVLTYPDLQFWDLTRRELSGVANAAAPGTTEKRRFEAFAKAMNTELDKLVPSYQQARLGAARFFGAEDAIDAGAQAVTSKMQNGEIRAGLAKMSPLEKQLFQDGFVDRYIQMIRESPDRRSVLNQIANSGAARERLMLALGPQRANELEAFLRVEGVMDLARPAVQGNSTTARQLVELGLAGGVDVAQGGGSFTADPKALMNAALVYGALRGQRAIDNRVAEQVARLLTSTDLAQVTKGIKLLAKNRTLMNAIRQADAGLAAIGLRAAAPPVARALQGSQASLAPSPNLVPPPPQQPQGQQPVPQPLPGQGQ